MFVSNDYKNYKYVVETSDNYLVLTNQSSINASWESPRTINVVYQYLEPSFLTIESTRTYSSSRSFDQVETSQSFYSRADFPEILVCQFLIIFFCLFVINGITRFVKKGGIFFGQ